MRIKSLLILAVLSIPVIVAASAPKLLLSWKNPDYSGGTHFTNILVLALNGQAANRAEFEDELVAAMDAGLSAAAGN